MSADRAEEIQNGETEGEGGPIEELKIAKFFPCVHYGYIILAVCTIGKTLTAPGQSPCIGVVINVIIEDIDISLTTVTALYFFATTASAICLTRMGRIIDLVGVQKMVLVIAFMLGMACFVISQARNVLVLLLSFFMLRFFGQGSLMMVSKMTINYWWVNLRGQMMGIAGALVSLGMTGIFPIVLNAAITTIGWRPLYIRLGLVSVFFMAPLGYIFYRNQPERYGMLPDGRALEPTVATETDGTKAADDTHGSKEVAWLPKDAFRTVAFWSNSISLLIVAASGTAFWFHLKGVMRDYSINPDFVNFIYPVLALSSVVGRIWSGRLIDSFKEKGYLVLVAGLIMNGSCMVLVPTMAIHENFLVLVCIVQGVGGSFVMNVASVVYANYFGRKHLGEIQGLADACGVLGSALGPLPFGYVRDVTGSFNSAFVFGAIFPFTCAVWVAIAGRRQLEKNKYLSLESKHENEIELTTTRV